MKWLITGGCGFIGTSLIKKLIEEGGHQITVVDNLSVGTRKDLANVCSFMELVDEDLSEITKHNSVPVVLCVRDILDDTFALRIAEGMDVIVHLAANTGVGPSVVNPRADCNYNVMGTFNYLEAARVNNVSKFIFASSGAPAGEVEPPIHEELPPHPVSPYGASKLAGEGYCSAYFRTFGVQTISLRFGNVYGPGSCHKSSVVAKFIQRALQGEPLEIYGDGEQTRDFIYIDDLIQAIRLSSKIEGIGGEVFQIATNSETTVAKMSEMLISVLHDSGVNNVKIVNAESRLGDVKRNYSDTSKARRMLGWKCDTSLDNGLKKTVQYFTERQ